MARGRSSDFPARPREWGRVTAAGLCRTLTGFPDSPVGSVTSRAGPRGTSCLSRVTIASRPRVAPSAPSRVDRRRHRRRRLARRRRAARAAADRRRRGPRRRPPSRRCCPTVAGQLREPWPSPLRDGLPALLERYADRDGRRARLRRPARLRHRHAPWSSCSAPSGVADRARPSRRWRWPAPGWAGRRSRARSCQRRRPRRRTSCSASSRPATGCSCCPPTSSTPAEVAGLLVAAGLRRAAAMTVLGDLGATGESRVDGHRRGLVRPGAAAQRRRPRPGAARSSGPGPPACPTTPSSTTAS